MDALDEHDLSDEEEEDEVVELDLFTGNSNSHMETLSLKTVSVPNNHLDALADLLMSPCNFAVKSFNIEICSADEVGLVSLVHWEFTESLREWPSPKIHNGTLPLSSSRVIVSLSEAISKNIKLQKFEFQQALMTAQASVWFNVLSKSSLKLLSVERVKGLTGGEELACAISSCILWNT